MHCFYLGIYKVPVLSAARIPGTLNFLYNFLKDFGYLLVTFSYANQ